MIVPSSSCRQSGRTCPSLSRRTLRIPARKPRLLTSCWSWKRRTRPGVGLALDPRTNYEPRVRKPIETGVDGGNGLGESGYPNGEVVE